jgi:hypothetical protein
MTQQIMSKHEGTAWRVQLDCMLNVLDRIEEAAIEARDADVVALIGHLRCAKDAAVSIEERPPLEAKGVRLDRN